MRFLQAGQTDIFWGIMQNVSLVVLFVSAVWHWAREKKARSITFTLIGAVVSSLLIPSANPTANSYNQPYEVTVGTAVTMSVLQVLLVAYLGTEAEWSNWKVDLGLGSMAGIALTVAQGLALQGPPWISLILHSVALAAVGVLVLLGIRKLKDQTLMSALTSALLLAVVMTLLAKAMGYRLILE